MSILKRLCAIILGSSLFLCGSGFSNKYVDIQTIELKSNSTTEFVLKHKVLTHSNDQKNKTLMFANDEDKEEKPNNLKENKEEEPKNDEDKEEKPNNLKEN